MTGAPARPAVSGRWGRRVAAALFALLIAGCSKGEVAFEARPAMWLVEDADTRIYLLGTMHALPADVDWEVDKVEAAIDASDELVLELAPEELAKVGEEFQRLAPRKTPLAIDRRLSKKALTAYRALEKSGPGGGFGGDALDDWAVMVAMGQRTAQNAKLVPANGVEAGLAARFTAEDKPIGGLETARGQLMLFETLDAKTQRALLTHAAEGADKGVVEVRAMTNAWTVGDVAKLERMINDDVDTVPAARKAIITDRNRAWTGWIEKRMAKPGTVMVAVGAGHLVGADGVPALLKAEGLKVVRVQ